MNEKIKSKTGFSLDQIKEMNDGQFDWHIRWGVYELKSRISKEQYDWLVKYRKSKEPQQMKDLRDSGMI